MTTDPVNVKVMVMVMDALEIPEEERTKFVHFFFTTVRTGINAKRSGVEQNGRKIVTDLLSAKQKHGEDFSSDTTSPPFDIVDMSSLRQWYQIDEEDDARNNNFKRGEAVFWFYKDFLECVCGKKVWGVQKYEQAISEARVEDYYEEGEYFLAWRT